MDIDERRLQMPEIEMEIVWTKSNQSKPDVSICESDPLVGKCPTRSDKNECQPADQMENARVTKMRLTSTPSILTWQSIEVTELRAYR